MDGSLSGQIVGWTKNAPFLGQLGDFSPTYAFRWLLWLAAVLGSLVGLLAVLAGTFAVILAVAPVASSTNDVLGAAASGTYNLADSLDSASVMVANMSNVSSTIADSLMNMSIGLGKTADGIENLRSLPGQGGQENWAGAAASLRASDAGLKTSAAQAREAGNSSVQAAAGISASAGNLRAMSSAFLTTQGAVAGAVMYAQIGIGLMGLALALLLGGVLALALAYGPPKKE